MKKLSKKAQAELSAKQAAQATLSREVSTAALAIKKRLDEIADLRDLLSKAGQTKVNAMSLEEISSLEFQINQATEKMLVGLI